MTVLFAWVASLGATYVRVLDVAQTAARQAARGVDSVPAPPGVSLDVGSRDGLIHAVASAQATPPLAAFTGWSVTVKAEAHAVPEWVEDVSTGDEDFPW